MKSFSHVLLLLSCLFSLNYSNLILPEFDNGVMHKYIIVCDQRYGGTWISNLLREQVTAANDPVVHIEGELYKKADAKPNLCDRSMKEFFASPKCEGRKICVFRIPYFVWKACDYTKLAIKEEIQFIHIIRENKIDWLISHGVASELRSNMKNLNITAAQVMHCKDGEKCYAEEVQKIKLLPLISINSMRDQTALDRNVTIAIQKANIRLKTLFYEDIVLVGTSLILDFMGINVTETNQTATTRFKKRITKPQEEVIENYTQFVKAVRKTEFRWFLDYCMKNIGTPDHC
jgi:hypothetical protein